MKRLILLCLFAALVGGVVSSFIPRQWFRGGVDQADQNIADVIELEGLPSQDLLPARSGQPTVMFANQVDTANLQHLTPEERVNVAVYEQVNRSVVNISTRAVRTDSFFMFETPQEGAGSGSILDKSGHILTNFHVVEGAREVQVTLSDGTTYDARPVGLDADTDIAVLKIDAPADSLHPVKVGTSSSLRVGQKVYAIGNPFGLERTLTVGIISSLNRSIRARNNRKIRAIIQTDAAINPGNSGGPLLDSKGMLIGVTTAIASRTGQSAGVGFAVPASVVRRVVPQLVRDGRVIRPAIGISRVVETEDGLVIATVTTGGPAEKAGLRGFKLVTRRRRQGPFVYEQTYVDRSSADHIVELDGAKITSADQFLDLIETRKPGDEVTVTVVREGKRVNVAVTLIDEGQQ